MTKSDAKTTPAVQASDKIHGDLLAMLTKHADTVSPTSSQPVGNAESGPPQNDADGKDKPAAH